VRTRVTAAQVDVAIAAALTLEGALEAWLAGQRAPSELLPAAVASGLLFAPIALRRRYPAPALLGSSTVFAAAAPLLIAHSYSGAPLLAPVLLAYGTGAWLAFRPGLASALGGAVLLFLALARTTGPGLVFDAFGAAAFVGLPWFLGWVGQGRARRAEAFRGLAVRAAADREERERLAIVTERERIGRELQDVVAHGVSAMVVHAAGARRTLRADPARSRESILAVERTGREALADMRQLLGLLRMDDDPRALAPQPGLERLPDLVESLGASGLGCELLVEGGPLDLTPGVDLAGYRLVETVLGLLVAGGCRRASVRVRRGGRALDLEVAADRRVPDLEPALGGIAERVTLYGGRIDVAGSEESVVRCRFPLEGGTAR
jgi:signal transduction histidine kinase